MKLTVITLTYNNSHLLPETIQSVLSQKIESLHLIEYLIVDDGSIDFDEENIRNVIFNNENNQFVVKIIKNKTNIGTVKSFNNAISKSTGELIVPLSAGDLFFNEFVLDEICTVFKNNQVNVATGRCAVISENGENVTDEYPNKNVELYFSPGNRRMLLRKLCIEGNFITGAATYYRKEYLLAQGGFDEAYMLLEDYPFYIHVLESGGLIYFINQLVIKYRTGGVSTNKKTPHPKLENDFDNLAKCIMRKPYLTQFQKEYVYYKRFIKRRDKLKIKYIMKYPRQTLIYMYKRMLKK